LVLASIENIPSGDDPLIGALPVYVQVRFKIDALSMGLTNGGFFPVSDEENVHPAG